MISAIAVGFYDVNDKSRVGIYHDKKHRENTEASQDYENWYGFTESQLIDMVAKALMSQNKTRTNDDKDRAQDKAREFVISNINLVSDPS